MNDIFRVPTAAASAADLLGSYHGGDAFFSSPHQTLLAQGVAATLPALPVEALADAARDLLAAHRRPGQPLPLLIGAIPFRSDAVAQLCIPARVHYGSGSAAQLLDRMQPCVATPAADVAAATATDIRHQPGKQGYQANVSQALALMQRGVLDKVVLSRSLRVAAQIDLPGLLQRLAQRNVLGYTFAVPLGDTQRTLIGASPELLLARRGRHVVSNPLAGSIPRSADPAEDQRRARGLLQSAKDLHEHAVVIDAVAAALRPFCSRLDVPAGPSLLATPTMWHLSTEMRGELADPATTSLQLALALHPTPAVCGHPTAAARDFIAEVEGFDRRYFTGLTGWCDADGDGEWAVTIRCAEVGAHDATLYAGAGIVPGSEPALEWRETSAKLNTMLGAMQLEAALADTPEVQS